MHERSECRLISSPIQFVHAMVRERNRIQARKTRTRNKMILKNLQDEIAMLRSENKLLKERVMELERGVRTSTPATKVDQPINENDASSMSDAIVQSLWMSVVDNKTEERYSSIPFQYPKTVAPATIPRYAATRDTTAWSNSALNSTNH